MNSQMIEPQIMLQCIKRLLCHFFMPHQPKRARGQFKPIILPVDRRVLDCFHEL
jgi:hypothetical protein